MDNKLYWLEENSIQAVINERGMTRQGLCKKSGLTRGALHKILAGADLRLSTAKKISEGLGCRISDLWDV